MSFIEGKLFITTFQNGHERNSFRKLNIFRRECACVCVRERERESVCCLTLPDAAIVAIVVAAILAQQKLNGAVKCNHCGV